jgi:hypothetical protein
MTSSCISNSPDIGYDEEETRNMHAESNTGSSSDTAVDNMLLERELRTVLENDELTSKEKRTHCYLLVEHYLYKKDPSFKPHQFKLNVRTSENGRDIYTLRERRWYQHKYFKFLPSLLGPIIGALCSVWFRSRECCCFA